MPNKVKKKVEPKPKPEGYTFGRPTTYDPSYCQMVIDAGREGKSKAEMAAMFVCTRQTLDCWARDHKDFSNALETGMELSLAWWENIGRSHITEQYGEGAAGSKVNSNLYSRSMAARFPKDWREKVEQTVQGPNGGPVAMTQLTPEAFKAIAKDIAGAV